MSDIKGLKLEVPYSQKDIVKNLGAKWDYKTKSWYIPCELPIKDFAPWIDKKFLLFDENKQKSDENKQKTFSESPPQTRTIKFYFQIRSGYPCHACKEPMNILQMFYEKPKNPLHTRSYEYAQTWSKPRSYVNFARSLGIKMSFRSTSIVSREYALHICPVCSAVQGDYFVFEDKDCRLPLVKGFFAIYDQLEDTWTIED